MQQYDFRWITFNGLSLLFSSAGTLLSSLSICILASVDQKLTINLRYLSGDFLLSFSSRGNVSVDNYAISSEGFGNFHCYHRGK